MYVRIKNLFLYLKRSHTNETFFKKITSCVAEMESLAPELRDWSKDEDEGSDLTRALSAMCNATEQTAKAISGLHKTHKTHVYPVVKEVNLFNESVNNTLQRRSTAQFK